MKAPPLPRTVFVRVVLNGDGSFWFAAEPTLAEAVPDEAGAHTIGIYTLTRVERYEKTVTVSPSEDPHEPTR